MRPAIAATMTSLMLAGCAAGAPDSAPTPPQGTCKADGLDRFLGQKATAVLGAQLLAASGAKALRWGPPGAIMTMDFRPDRLTVAYDAQMLILSARCG